MPLRHLRPDFLSAQWALVLFWAWPGIVLGQPTPPPSVPALGSDGRAGASVAAGAGVTGLRGREVGFGLADAHLQLTPRIRLGMQGVRLSREVLASSVESQNQSRVRLSYGGVRADVDTGQSQIHAGILIAGATARLRSSLVDQEVAVRNFLLVEPQVRRALAHHSRFSLEAQAGYRIPLGAPSLPGVTTADLRGPTLSLTARVHRAP
jgi:hypothetical protein